MMTCISCSTTPIEEEIDTHVDTDKTITSNISDPKEAVIEWDENQHDLTVYWDMFKELHIYYTGTEVTPQQTVSINFDGSLTGTINGISRASCNNSVIDVGINHVRFSKMRDIKKFTLLMHEFGHDYFNYAHENPLLRFHNIMTVPEAVSEESLEQALKDLFNTSHKEHINLCN